MTRNRYIKMMVYVLLAFIAVTGALFFSIQNVMASETADGQVTVTTANQFVEAIKDKTVNHIVLGADVDLTDATNYAAKTTNVVVLQAKRNDTKLVIDGQGKYTLREKNYNGIRSDYPHLSTSIRWTTSGTLEEVVFKDMTIVGYSVYGTMYTTVSKKKLSYDNVSYTGPQPIYAPSSTAEIKDSDFDHVWRSKYSTVDQGEIGGEAARVILDGDVTYTNYDRKGDPGQGGEVTRSSQDEVFYMHKQSGINYEIRLKSGANVTIDINTGGGTAKASGFVYWALNGSLVLEDQAVLDYQSNWGSFSMYHPMDLTIQSGAELNIYTSGASYSYNDAGNTLLSLSMEPGAKYHHVAENLGTGAAVVNLFPYYREKAEGLVNIDNASSVLLYSDQGPTLKVQSLYYANVDMAMTKAAYWNLAGSVTLAESSRNGIPIFSLGDYSANPDYYWSNNEDSETWVDDDVFEVHGTLHYSTKSNWGKNNYYYKDGSQPKGYQSWRTEGYEGITGVTDELTNEQFSPYNKQVFLLNGHYDVEVEYTDVKVNYYQVDQNGEAELNDTVSTRVRVGSEFSVIPAEDKYPVMETDEEGNEVPTDRLLYLLNLERSNAANQAFTVDSESGAVSFFVTEVYEEGEEPVIVFYYDINRDEIPEPGEQADTVQRHALVGKEGQVLEGYPVEAQVYTGTYGQSETIDFTDEMRDRYRNEEEQDANYIYDEDATLAYNTAQGLVIGDTSITFIYGVNEQFTIFYALDSDGDGIPDYGNSGAGSEAMITLTADDPTKPVNPVDPEYPEDDIEPEDESEIKHNSGRLKIDYVSNFRFGEGSIVGNGVTLYSAPVNAVKGGITYSTPNFVQVTDLRGTYSGWSLRVKQDGYFIAQKETIVDKELNGAEITIRNITANTRDYNEKVSAAGGEIVLSGTAEEALVMSAASGQGGNTHVAYFGDLNDGDRQSAATSVELFVPKDANLYETSYEASIVWILADVPANIGE